MHLLSHAAQICLKINWMATLVFRFVLTIKSYMHKSLSGTYNQDLTFFEPKNPYFLSGQLRLT